MATGQASPLLGRLRRAALLRDGAGLPDVRLLEQFVRQKDETAFASLVRRHGPMVMGVCLRALRHRQDAEDAFQATFLVLVSKAADIRFGERLANWLYGVAYHMALKVRTTSARRRARERCLAGVPEPATVPREAWDDLPILLDRELSRLPDKYRIPVVLCDLQNKSRREAADQLGWPEGTLSGRLSRARALLARRLSRRGVALTGGSLVAAIFRDELSACVTQDLTTSTVEYGTLLAAGRAQDLIPPRLTALLRGGMEPMRWTRGKAILVFLGLCAVGLAALGYLTATAQEAERPAQALVPKSKTSQKGSVSSSPKTFASQVLINMELFERSPNGEEKCRATPKLVTLLGRPASILNGGEFPTATKDGTGIEFIPFGVKCTATVSKLPNGRLRLRGEFEKSMRDSKARGEDWILRTWGVQLCKTVNSGDPVDLELDTGGENASHLRIRLTVTLLDSEPTTK
jgi:RNA polymerase sigma factor (sigma-70 family)